MIPSRQNQHPITLSTRSHVRLLIAPWPWLTARATFDVDGGRDDERGDGDSEGEDVEADGVADVAIVVDVVRMMEDEVSEGVVEVEEDEEEERWW
jgi:hypothetical protein